MNRNILMYIRKHKYIYDFLRDDSKYYKYGITSKPSHLPGTDSIVKQMENRIVEIYEVVKGESGKTYEQIIGRIDGNVANAISADPQMTRLKSCLEQNAKYIANTNAMINEATIDIKELDSFFDVIHVPSTMISTAPNRIMRVVTATVVSFLFMIFVFIFADFYKKYNK